MSRCEEVGRWIEDTILLPVEQFFQRAHEECTEARRWVEREVRVPIETWAQQQEQRCREQECNWFCLCCNKWFCWLVTVLVKVIVWVVKVIGEWLVEFICKLVVEIVRTIVLVAIHVLKWIVEFFVCVVERLCAYLFLLAGIALVGLLVGLVAVAGSVMPLALPLLLAGVAVAAAAVLLGLVLCEPDRCRLLGILVWVLKWSIVLGAPISIIALSAASGLVVVLYGGIVTALILYLAGRACRVPRLLGPP